MTYSVKVTITTAAGPVYNLQIAQGDDTDGNVAPAYGLADPLVIKQSLGAGDRLPLTHPSPSEATVTIIAPDATTYPALALGDSVWVEFYTAAAFAGTPAETFGGRIASLSGQGHDLGVLYTLGCVDYTADLAEIQVGGTANWPVEFALARVQRIFADAGVPEPPRNWVIVTSTTQAARNAAWTDALSATLETLDSWFVNDNRAEDVATALTGAHGLLFKRPWLFPVITAGVLDPNTPFELHIGSPYSRRCLWAPPGRLVNNAGVWGITVDAANSSPSTGAPILDGGRVSFAPIFAQSKGGGLANVTIGTDAQGNRQTWDWRTRAEDGYYSFSGGMYGPGGVPPYPPATAVSGPAVVQEITSQVDVTNTGGIDGLVLTYRTPFRPDTGALWDVQTLTWQAWSEASGWVVPELTQLLTVSRAVAAKLPTNREWVTGLVVATTLTVQGGRPTVDIDLMANVHDFQQNREAKGASLGVCSLDSPILTGVLLSALKARDSFWDYSIVRGT